MTRGWAALLAGCALAGCGHGDAPPAAASAKSVALSWQAIVTDADRDRLRRWRDAWMAALPLAKRTGAAVIAADPSLFDPDRALSDAMPPPGDYHCRMFKLGANGVPAKDFIWYPTQACRVTDEGEAYSLRLLDGAQRPAGLLLRDTDARAIFLGTLVLGDETTPLQYGRDATRDMAGYVERVGPGKWRLVLPWPHFESLLDVVELTPAG